MKAKDYIIIGGAVALLLLWQKNKTKKDSTSTIVGSSGTNAPNGTATTTTGSTTIGSNPIGTSQVTVLDTPPPSNEPEQIFGLGLPAGMDLPNLTAGTGVPTEVAVQLGGVRTEPKPAIVQESLLTIEEALGNGGVKPILKPYQQLTTEPIIIVPREQPTPYLAQS